MLSTLDLTPFVCSFVNSIANQYFFDVLYDNVLHSLSEKIPEEQIKLETNLRDFEQGFVEKVTKREVFIEALQESDFGSYFFNSKNCQDQIISIITQFIDEKDVWGAAVFLNKYLEVVRNHGNSFSEENELKLDDLKKRYKKELFPNVLLGISNEYRENYLTQLKKAEKEIRKIAGDMTFLVPGIGAQGGDLKAVMEVGLNSEGLGLIINSSRGIIFSDSPKEEAEKLCEEMRKYKDIL